MQKDLDAYLSPYNRERTHQGLGHERTGPCQEFVDGLPKNEKKSKKASKEAA